MLDESANARRDLITDSPNLGDAFAFRIWQRPVFPFNSWDNWTLLSAAHGDEHRSRRRERRRQSLGLGVRQLDAELAHDGYDLGVDVLARIGARRNPPRT